MAVAPDKPDRDHMKRSLLLTNDYPPAPGGISRVFFHLWQWYPEDRMRILSPGIPGAREFDRRSGRAVLRFPAPSGGGAARLISSGIMAALALGQVVFRGVREIHAGQILSCGPAGYLLQLVFGIPCWLWLYGGETSSAYRRSRMEEWLVARLLHGCRFLVTNSPDTTREFLAYGIPSHRIVEILPGVDSKIFTPGPRPEHLVRRYGLEEKRVLLTVSRLAKRKGHDLVFRALKLLRDYADIYYVIVGDGDDRPRLERLAGETGLADRVIFTGRVDEADLPDYYRLADLYVMPNREVPEVTDSIEGFGISFIEASACGKPAIAGRSGGTAAAVIEGETGFRVDPENPEELADRIRFLLDHPEAGKEMGRKGRERVAREFEWEARSRELASRLTVSLLPIGEKFNGNG